ncbi:MAG: hypothetical protein ACE5NM_04800, partial [Sedimentisphaerales bacterium]
TQYAIRNTGFGEICEICGQNTNSYTFQLAIDNRKSKIFTLSTNIKANPQDQPNIIIEPIIAILIKGRENGQESSIDSGLVFTGVFIPWLPDGPGFRS